MRRILLLSSLFALVLVVPAGAQEPTIMPGISAAGVDLSNLTVSQAAAKLDTELLPRLQADLVIGVAGRAWTLKTGDAKLKLDSVRTAKRALYAKAPATTVEPRITHSRLAVKAFVQGIAGNVSRSARNAAIRITLRHIYRKRSRKGRGLAVDTTRAMIDTVLDSAAAPRKLHKRLTIVSAKVNANDLARSYSSVITIDKAHFRLRLFKHLKFSRSYLVAVGQPAYPTPRGQFSITSKQVNPTWSVPNSAWAGELQGTTVQGGSAANPLKARWMGLAGGVGIHGTGEDYSIGSRASHGCIRMHVWDVKDLFGRVSVGTPVLIR